MKQTIRMLFAALLIVSATSVYAQDSSLFKVTELTENLYLLTTNQGEYTTNTIALVGDDGILLVDTQTADEAEELKKIVDSFGKGVPKYIINTHRHIEHIGGNAIFGKEPVIIAHELVPAKLKSGLYLFNEFPDATYPDITLSDSLTLYFNGEKIRIIALAGSHDDNEIIVHFTKSKVVHLSSLTNGFNFPSVDSDGDALRFDELVARAIDLLPQDVVIVSGHNDVGSYNDLLAYHDMLVKTEEAVRRGLPEGKDLATLQKEKVLGEWESYAGSYVSVDEWTKYLFEGLQGKKKTKKSVYEPLYYAYKEGGPEAALEKYEELKRDHSDEYTIDDVSLAIIGYVLAKRSKYTSAMPFLEASLEQYPDGPYNWLANYFLAVAHKERGNKQQAIKYCEKTLELNPGQKDAQALLEELKK